MLRTPGTTGADRSPQRRCHRSCGPDAGLQGDRLRARGAGARAGERRDPREPGQAGSALTWREAGSTALSTDPPPRAYSGCRIVPQGVHQHRARASLGELCLGLPEGKTAREGAVGAKAAPGPPMASCPSRPGRRPDWILPSGMIPPPPAGVAFKGHSAHLTPSSPARSSSLVLRVPLRESHPAQELSDPISGHLRPPALCPLPHWVFIILLSHTSVSHSAAPSTSWTHRDTLGEEVTQAASLQVPRWPTEPLTVPRVGGLLWRILFHRLETPDSSPG